MGTGARGDTHFLVLPGGTLCRSRRTVPITRRDSSATIARVPVSVALSGLNKSQILPVIWRARLTEE